MPEQRPDRQPGKNGRPPQTPGTPGGPGGMKVGRGVLGWVLFICLAVMLIVLLQQSRNSQHELTWNEFLPALQAGNVQTLVIEGDELTGKLVKPISSQRAFTDYRVTLPVGMSSDPALLFKLTDTAGLNATAISANNNSNLALQLLVPFVPWLIIFVFIYFFVFKPIRNNSGAGGMLGNFGRSRHKLTSKEHTNVTFDDVAGVQEAKDEVQEIVEFLKNPKKFQRLGGRIPRGVLLVGEPGTGKTLLAKAIAGEADAPFFSISGSDFVEMFVGVGASRVRDLFKQAKDNSPCIIFLDEIDAVGRRRGSGFSSGGHDEREQTLNAILVEMDGFDTNDQVIVVASTNRVDVLDPALTRPGRFDRQVYVPLPDVKGRMEILKVHARKVKLGPNVDLARLARATPGFSGADLAAVINESALGATLAGKDFIEQDDLEEARDKVRWGRAKKSRVIDEKDKIATAYHEAGHAVVQMLLRPDSDPIHKVTIIPRGNFGGALMTLPERDRTSHSRKWCIAFMKVGMAGRISEEMFTGDVNTGAYSDIRQVTGYARHMVRDWGMNDRVGFVYLGENEQNPNGSLIQQKEYSEETAKAIDEEIKKLIDSLYEQTRQLIEANKDRVQAIADALMKYETLDSNDIDRIMRGDLLTRPTVSEMIDKPPTRTPLIPPPAPESPGLGLGGGPLPQPG